MRGGDGFILVYSITAKSSFIEIEPVYQQIVKIKVTELFLFIDTY